MEKQTLASITRVQSTAHFLSKVPGNQTAPTFTCQVALVRRGVSCSVSDMAIPDCSSSGQHCSSNPSSEVILPSEKSHQGNLPERSRLGLAELKWFAFRFIPWLSTGFTWSDWHRTLCFHLQPLRQELKSIRSSLHALCVVPTEEWEEPQSIWGTASCVTSLPLCKVWRPPANTPLGNIPVGVKPLRVSTLSLSSLEAGDKEGGGKSLQISPERSWSWTSRTLIQLLLSGNGQCILGGKKGSRFSLPGHTHHAGRPRKAFLFIYLFGF